MRFSIVIPTLNRADKLRYALRSALAQDLDQDNADWEVVVSNNCSTDETDLVLQQSAGPRLRVIRPDERLSMPDHWEFATQQARGEWVLVLCDDDALFPNALSHLNELSRRHPGIDLIHYGQLIYTYSEMLSSPVINCDQPEARGSTAESTGSYVDLPTRIPLHAQPLDSPRKLLTTFWRIGFNLPKMLNSAARRGLLERIRERHGAVFSEWAPDFAAGIKLLANTPRHLRTGPLMLWGENMASYGAGSWRDPHHLLSFLRQFRSFTGQLDESPYPDILTVHNTACDTLWRVRRELGAEGRRLEIDPVRFRRLLRSDLRKYVAHGHEAFREPLARVERDLQFAKLRRWWYPWPLARVAATHFRGLPEMARRAVIKSRAATHSGRITRRVYADIYEAALDASRRIESAWSLPGGFRRAA